MKRAIDRLVRFILSEAGGMADARLMRAKAGRVLGLRAALSLAGARGTGRRAFPAGRWTQRLWLLAIVLCTTASLGSAVDARPRTIEVLHPWIPAPPVGAPTAAGYVTFKNAGARPDTFLSASTPAAQTLSLHLMTTKGGVMRMRPVLGGMSVAPGQSLELSSASGYHFMFEHLAHPLHAGDRVPVSLTFSKAGVVKTQFVVQVP